eukprot:6035478-Lingulodinium_polyedra.AAC.1
MARGLKRFASRSGGGQSTQPQHDARLLKPCTMTRSNRPSTAATARESRAQTMQTQTLGKRTARE